jgi:non-ribosomal peptide synthetase component E (peptide arylation enzyme)
MILVGQEMAQNYVEAGIWGKVRLDSILARIAADRPTDIALIDRGDRLGWKRSFSSELTWQQVDRMVSTVSAEFLDSGLKQDDVIAVQLANTTETLITYLAALRAGLIPVALPLTWRERELKAAFKRVPPIAVVTATRIGPNDHCDLLMRAAAESLSVRHIFAYGATVPDGVWPLNNALLPEASTEGANGAPRTGNPADHVAIVTFANWEGRLEPIARSHNQWLTAAMETVLDARIGPDAVIATTLLPSSLAGIACGLAAWLLAGCRLILVMPVTSAAFCREIGQLAATHLVLPGHLTHLAARLDPDRRMRLIRYWASPDAFAPSDGQIKADTTMTDVVSLDEMAITAASGRMALVLPVAPVGADNLTNVDLEKEPEPEPDPKEVLLSARMPGAMFRAGGSFVSGALMSGPQVPLEALPTKGDAVEDSFRFKPHPDGFRETGLRCRRIDNGKPMLAVQGHRKETFVTGGASVTAESLDAVYRAFDGFLDAAAASIPDPLFGERIVAAVVPRPGMDCSLAVFRAYLRSLGVAAHMVPERIITVQEIPKASDGAVLRSAIATSLAA